MDDLSVKVSSVGCFRKKAFSTLFLAYTTGVPSYSFHHWVTRKL